MNGKYDDMIYMPHPVSKKHLPMKRQNRAAQFSPFAALTGYDAAIREVQRLTEEKRILAEDARAEIEGDYEQILRQAAEHPWIQVTYFQQDEKKEGGMYQSKVCRFKRMDRQARVLISEEGNKIPMADIVSLHLVSLD